MANTFNDYTATSAQLDSSDAAYGFVFNFPFLDASHIVVEVDGSVLASSNYSIQTSPDKRVLVASGITTGQVVRVKRDSNADSDAPLVDFVNGSVLNETELDKSYLHNLYLNEEIAAMNDLSLQKKVGDTTKWDAKSQELVNVTDPTLVQSASTKNYVDTQISNTITGSSTVSSKYTFTGDNTTTAFTFNPAINLDGDTMYEVAIDGVLQAPTTAYAIDANANTITFSSAPPTSAAIVVVQRGYAVPVTLNSQGLRVAASSGISGTASFIQDGDGTNSALAISSTAVGIGTASPSDKIEIISNSPQFGATITNTTANPARLTLANTEGSANIDCNNNLLVLTNNTASDLVIDSAGNVGIGMTDPKNKLSVICGTTPHAEEGGISLHTVNAASNHGSNGPRAYIVAKLSNNWKTNLLFKVNKLDINAAPTEAMRIDSDGNVGIGTTSPDVNTQLHIKNNETANFKVERNKTSETNAQNGYLKFTSAQAHSVIYSKDLDNNNKDLVIDAGTVFIKGSNLGIENTDGTNSCYISNIGSSGASTLNLGGDSTNTGGLFVLEEGHGVNQGNVGIGTASPTAPLEVASTTGGVIMPRLTTTQMNAISSPTDGEMIYNTTANKFYGRAGGSWVALH